MRNVLAHAGKSGRRVVSAFIRHAFRPGDAGSRKRPMARLRRTKIRPKVPKLAVIMDDTERRVLAYMTSRRSTAPSCTRPTRSSASTAKSSAGPGRRHFPNDDAIVRLVGAILLEQNDEWACAARPEYMTLETITR